MGACHWARPRARSTFATGAGAYYTGGDGGSTLTTSSRRTQPETPGRKSDLRRFLPTAREASYDAKDEKASRHKTKWLAKQEKKMKRNEHAQRSAKDWEKLYDAQLLQTGKRDGLELGDMARLFAGMGLRVNRAMLQLLFHLFDANNSGTIDKKEFITSTIFLTQRGTGKDNVDLAFRLFDANLSGSISKAEFSEMVVGLTFRASFLLAIPGLRKAFRLHLESERCEESLNFIEAVERHRVLVKKAVSPRRSSLTFLTPKKSELGEPEVAELPVNAAQEIYDKFVSVSASEQVNLSDVNRRNIQRDLEEAAKRGYFTMSSASFDGATNEILGLLETDALPRFQAKIRNDNLWLADQVWSELGMKPSANMDKKKFRVWAERNKGVFSFLDELRVTMKRAELREKTLASRRIQKAWRSHRQRQGSMVQLVAKVLAEKDDESEEEERAKA